MKPHEKPIDSPGDPAKVPYGWRMILGLLCMFYFLAKLSLVLIASLAVVASSEHPVSPGAFVKSISWPLLSTAFLNIFVIVAGGYAIVLFFARKRRFLSAMKIWGLAVILTVPATHYGLKMSRIEVSEDFLVEVAARQMISIFLPILFAMYCWFGARPREVFDR